MATQIRILSRNFISLWFPVLRAWKYPSHCVKYIEHFTKNQHVLHKFWQVPLSIIIPTVAAASVSSPGTQKLIDELEALYAKNDFSGVYDLLTRHRDSKDANVLWRLARAATDKGKLSEEPEKKRLIYEAWEYINKALELDENNFACHKWYGILLNYTGEYEGIKKRLANAFKTKEHFLRAIELNPKDATTVHCLGYWCFVFADMPWYQRKIAATLFASPPTSSYQESLEYFLKAEEAEPGFYNYNTVMLGKTYHGLNDKETAKMYLLKALKHEDKTADDAKARKEAVELLKELGVTVDNLQ